MGVDVGETVQQAAGLVAHRGDDARVAVPDGRDPEPGGEVEIAVAVDVEDIASQGLAPQQAGLVTDQGVDPGSLVRRQLARQGARARTGNGGAEPRRQVAAE